MHVLAHQRNPARYLWPISTFEHLGGSSFPPLGVPGYLSPNNGRDGTFRGIFFFVLGFSRRGVLIGEGWAPGAWWGPLAIAGRGPTLGCAPMGCGPLGPRPQVVFGLRKLPDLLFTEEKISPDFDDIFRVGFLKPKTAGNTELAIWHLVNRLVLENA